MLINCKNCRKKIIINKSELDLEGSLVTCAHCKEEWIYESKTHYLESRLAELDQDLNNKEIILNEENEKHNKRIILLENELKTKNEELIKQNLLEKKIATFEKRITNTEKLNSYHADLEIQKSKLEDVVKKTSENIIIKNKDIEKKTNYLKMKINSHDFEKINNQKDNIAVNDINNDVVNLNNYDQEAKNNKKKKKHTFFWPESSD
jgi:predicted Zn finger-like uncharacterized protein